MVRIVQDSIALAVASFHLSQRPARAIDAANRTSSVAKSDRGQQGHGDIEPVRWGNPED